MGIDFQKSAIPTFLQFARVRAAHQPHVGYFLLFKIIVQSCPIFIGAFGTESNKSATQVTHQSTSDFHFSKQFLCIHTYANDF